MSNVENLGDDGGASMMGSLMGGANQPLGANAKIGISADTKAVSKLKGEFSSLRAELKRVREEMEGIARASKSIQGPGRAGVIAGVGAAGTPMAGGIFDTTPVSTGAAPSADQAQIAGAAGAMGRGAGAVGAAGTVINAGISALDARIDRSRDYALSADRMSLVYQQMYGLSQNQVANQFRTPMANMLLGAGGINELMSMQATTGISALQQAPSVEAMRVMSGFSLSTGQITNMISQLAAPDVANRMFMFGGTGLIGPGGQQRDTMQVIQDIARSAGLTDPRLARSAMAPGSITRANLTMMGVTGEMQDMVLQYAQQNLTYQQKGGRGMYDPRNKEAQKIMGIEDNFAMEAERTDAARVSREEQFYKRQADNYADMERQTRRLVNTMRDFEDAMSGIIGQAIGSRGARQIGGAIGTAVGAVAGSFVGSPVAGAIVGNVLGQVVGSAVTGDATGGDDGNTSVPIGYGNETKPRSQLESSSTFSNLHPTFKQRLLRMISDNPAVGIGEGFRTSAQQERMFLDRYRPTSEKTDIYWRGSYWRKVKGANAAPPGRSMHEIGLAADLVGDVDWVVKNASKYGLKTYEKLGEPWHIQPADLPGSRAEYEKGGAPWGTMGQFKSVEDSYAPSTNDTPVEGGGVSMAEGSMSDVLGAASLLGSQLGIQDQIDLTTAFVRGSRAPGGSGTNTNSPSGTTTSKSTTTSPELGGGVMSGEAVAKLLYAAGFRGKDLADALAISWRESHWNPGAFANDEDDLSYGLFQHNMIPGATNPEGNRQAWGIPNNEALFDPITNVRIAYEKYKWNKSKNRHPFDGWFIDGSHLGRTGEIYSEATRIARQIEETGDPVPAGSTPPAMTSAQSANISGNHTFHISPNITINGSASNTDLHQIAKTVARMLEKEIRTSTLRSI